MAPRAPRKGFGYDPEGHHTGFRDGVGHRYRSGTAEFVWVAFEWADQYEDVAPAYCTSCDTCTGRGTSTASIE